LVEVISVGAKRDIKLAFLVLVGLYAILCLVAAHSFIGALAETGMTVGGVFLAGGVVLSWRTPTLGGTVVVAAGILVAMTEGLASPAYSATFGERSQILIALTGLVIAIGAAIGIIGARWPRLW
jgi:hypothetical protein